jgi:hypothetical protein
MKQDEQTLETKTEVMTMSAIEAQERASVDIQIATARKYPRSMKAFKTKALDMATIDQETAESCIYQRPVGGGKFAEGLSVRSAEIVACSYGNLRVAARVVSRTEREVIVQGMAHDLESNYAVSCEVIESTVKKDGTPYDERMRVVIAKAALAKARRDATFQVIPKSLCNFLMTAARAVIAGDDKTLEQRREAVLTWLSKLGIDLKRVWAALAIAGPDELGLDQLATLSGIKTALKDGETTIDESFPSIIAVPVTPLFKGKAAPASNPAPKEPNQAASTPQEAK